MHATIWWPINYGANPFSSIDFTASWGAFTSLNNRIFCSFALRMTHMINGCAGQQFQSSSIKVYYNHAYSSLCLPHPDFNKYYYQNEVNSAAQRVIRGVETCCCGTVLAAHLCESLNWVEARRQPGLLKPFSYHSCSPNNENFGKFHTLSSTQMLYSDKQCQSALFGLKWEIFVGSSRMTSHWTRSTSPCSWRGIRNTAQLNRRVIHHWALPVLCLCL